MMKKNNLFVLLLLCITTISLNAQVLINANVDINGFRHNHDCGNDAAGNDPEPRYKVWIGSNAANFSQVTNGPGIYPGCTVTYGANEIPCSFWNPGLINAAQIVGQPINQINIDLESWEEDGCGSDCEANTCTFNSDDVRCPRTRIGDINFWNLPPCTNNIYVGEFNTGSFLSMHDRCSDRNGAGYGIDELIINWSFASSPTILSEAAPFDRTLCLGDVTSLEVQVDTWNGWSLGQLVQWQISENTDCATPGAWTNIPGATSLIYEPAQIPGTRLYRCIISSNCSDITIQNVISECVRVTYNPYAAPIISAACGGSTVSDVPVQFCTTQAPNAGASVGTTYTWTVSPSTNVTISDPNSPCTDITFDDEATYTITLTYGDGCPAADAQVSCVTTVSASSCDMIYVDGVTGNNVNLGYPDEPVANLWRAMELVGGARTNIRISGGTYLEPNIINLTTDLVIEGSWVNNSGVWTKASNSNTNLNFSGEETLSTSVTHKVGFKGENVSNWSVQDLNIITTNNTGTAADGRGKSNYGFLLNDCSNYNISRVNITTGTASAGANGVNGTPGIDGLAGDIGLLGHCDNNTTNRFGGAGGAAVGAGVRLGGQGGQGGMGSDYDADNNTIGTNGNPGGGGAAAGTNNGARGANGGCGTDTDRDGRKGQDGTAGANGANANAVAPLANNTFNNFWIPNGASASGADGQGGGGGKGGGGGGRQSGTWCDNGGGSGGGGGGSGAEGGQAGTGGLGGGGSFGIYRFNSSTGAAVQDIVINLPGTIATGGTAGVGATGGVGGRGGCGEGGNNTSLTVGGVLGTNGGNCNTARVCGNAEVGAGGQGGVGGAGGAGGNGQPGASGINEFMVTDGVLSNPSTSIPNPTTIIASYPVNAKGCVNSEITLNNFNPDFWVTPGAALIEDEAPGVSSYAFSDGNIIVSYPNSGVYDIATNGANYLNWIRIIDDSRPGTTNFNNPTSVCSGTLFSISADAWGTEVGWEWVLFETDANNPISVQTSQTANFVVPTVATGTTYFIRYRVREACCGWSIPYYTSFIVDENLTPTIAISGPTDICAGSTVDLTASAGDAFLWSNGATTQSITVNATGTYSVTVTDNSGCSGTSADVDIIVNPLPTPNVAVNGSLELCDNETVTLTSDVFSSYTWSSGQTTQAVVISEPGTYEVTITDANGCTATSAPITVTQTEVLITSSASTELCPGQSLELTASAGDTYQWQFNGANISGETTNSLTVTSEGTYTVVVEIGACTTTSEEVVVTEFNPSISLSGPTEVCPGNPLILNASTGDTFQWALNGTAIPGANSATYSTDVPGSYTVTIGLGTCSGTTAPIVLTSFQAQLVASGDVTVCDGETVELLASGGSNYSWTQDGVSIGGNVDNYIADESATYSVTIDNGNGCSLTESIEVTVTEPITAAASITDASCGEPNGSLSITASGGSGTYSYDWSPLSQTSNTLTNIGQGSYSVSITDDLGCSATETFNVSDSGPFTITVTPSSATIQSGSSVDLEVTGGNTYSWTPGIGLSCTNCANPTASPTETTTYIVTAADNNGCETTAQVTITVEAACVDIFVPTIFSPNNDGNNDILCVYGSCISTLNFEVFNRWGEKVFETTDPESCWDGTQNNKELNSGVYVYKVVVLLNDGNEIIKSGNITLVK
jgi:gliding motility-associated-like protein